MSRIAVFLAVAVAGSSCASQPALRVTLNQVSDWKPNELFSAKIRFEMGAESYIVRLDMTRTLFPCVGDREDGSLDMDALFILGDGTEVTGVPKRVVPELGDTGTFRSAVEVSFPYPASRSRPEVLKLRVQREQATFRVVIDVY